MQGGLKILAICSIVLISCNKQVSLDSKENLASALTNNSLVPSLPANWNNYLTKLKATNDRFLKTDGHYRYFFSNPAKAVEPNQCNATLFNQVIDNYFKNFEFWDYVLFSDYVWINQLSAISDSAKQYFGRTGQYTQLVARHARKLESFWKLSSPIRVNGQHSETLGNRDKIAKVFILFSGLSREDGYYVADQIIEMNKESKVFPQSPLLSFDGFATTTQLIVLGDGLIEALTLTGVVDDIVVAGLLSHEWGHQVQFENSKRWYGFTADNRPFTPEFTRQSELEADFFSSYFLTHKRGGAYNWKKVIEFNELFYTIGDCDYTSSGHHGTPVQRQRAAKLGYTLANQTQPQGHILTAQQLHAFFIKNVHTLL